MSVQENSSPNPNILHATPSTGILHTYTKPVNRYDREAVLPSYHTHAVIINLKKLKYWNSFPTMGQGRQPLQHPSLLTKQQKLGEKLHSHHQGFLHF